MDREEERRAIESGLLKKKKVCENGWGIQGCCKERVFKKTKEVFTNWPLK